jgi:biotin/methionine sulfoxide reductase
MTTPTTADDDVTPTVLHWGRYLTHVRNGRIVGVAPDPRDPAPSPIAQSIIDATRAPARVMQPMVRKGYLNNGPRKGNNPRGAEPFVSVSWDEALTLAAAALTETKTKYGNRSIFGGSYGWSSAGRFHHAQGQLQRFLGLFGGFTDHRDSYSYGAMQVILPHVIGDHLRMRRDVPTWGDIAKHTGLFVAFGGVPVKNTQVNPGGLLQHTAIQEMAACRKAGVEFVNIGPLRDDITEHVDAQWISIRPNTDAAFMLAVAYVLITENIYDADFTARCCVGFDALRAYVTGIDANGTKTGVAKTPAWAANICGCAADEIATLARKIAAKRSVISMIWAVQRGDHGEQAPWLAVVLSALSGSLGKPGGGMGFGYGSVHAYGLDFTRLRAPGYGPGVNPVKDFIPVARISDALLNPGGTVDYNGKKLTYADLRTVYWVGGNPFHHHQDLNKLVRAWREPETIIVNEPFWTSTARYADIVLPTTTPLERNDIAFGEGHFMANKRAIAPVGQSRTDYEIFADLADKVGLRDAFTEGRDEMQWLNVIYSAIKDQAARTNIELPDFDTFWADGVVTLPTPPRPAPLFSQLREDPDKNLLNTPTGKVELFSQTIADFNYDDCPGHPVWMEPKEWLGSELALKYPLHLVTNQPTTRLHSQYDNGATSTASKIKGREPLRMHPDDAAARGIVDGDVVRVFNDRGAFLAGVIVSDHLRSRVAQIATGAWYDPEVPGALGTLDVHGNPNVVTPDRGTSKLAQGSSALSTLVEIEKFVGELPPIKVFDAPPMESNGVRSDRRSSTLTSPSA